MDGGEELGVREGRGEGLLGGFVVVVGAQEVGFGEGVGGGEGGAEGGEDAGLPVYEGAVDVEGKGLVGGKEGFGVRHIDGRLAGDA